jgi:hypothetical protein
MKQKMKYIKLFEELNISNTYFTRSQDDNKNIEIKIEDLIKDISNNLNIELPVKEWSEDFLKIKKEVLSEISKNEYLKNYFDGKDKKIIENLILKFCSGSKESINKNNTEKINIENLNFKLIDHVDNIETYQVIFPEDVKNFIINNHSTNKLDYLIYINCESDNFNRLHFPGRIERVYRSNGKRFGKDEQPQPYKGKHGKWISDLFDGIPQTLRGTGLGYSIYKEFLKYKGYLSSGSWSSSLSQSVWKKMTSDPEVFGILINYKGQDGNLLLFDRKFKGDIKKISLDFIEKAKIGKLYKGNLDDFQIINIDIDNEIKNKIGNEFNFDEL